MKKKLTVIILLVIIVVASFNYYTNFKKINKLESEISKLNKEIESSKQKNEKLNEQLVNINDEEFIEKVARTKLGLVKPGEVLVIPVKDQENVEENAN